MARRPADRFLDAGAFAEALRCWSAGQAAPFATPTVDAPAPARPAVVRVELPDGSPVTVSVDHTATPPRKVAVSVREGRPTKGKRRRLAVTVTVTFALLIGVGLTLGLLAPLTRPGPDLHIVAVTPPPDKGGPDGPPLEKHTNGPPLEKQPTISLFNGQNLEGWSLHNGKGNSTSWGLIWAPLSFSFVACESAPITRTVPVR